MPHQLPLFPQVTFPLRLEGQEQEVHKERLSNYFNKIYELHYLNQLIINWQ